MNQPLSAGPLSAGPASTGPVSAEPMGIEPVGMEPVGMEPMGMEPMGAVRPPRTVPSLSAAAIGSLLGALALALIAVAVLSELIDESVPDRLVLVTVFGAIGSIVTAFVFDARALAWLRAASMAALVVFWVLSVASDSGPFGSVFSDAGTAGVGFAFGMLLPTFALLRGLPDLLLAIGVIIAGLIVHWERASDADAFVYGSIWLLLAAGTSMLLRSERLTRNPRLVRRVAGPAEPTLSAPTLRWWPVALVPLAMWLLAKGLVRFLSWLLRDAQPRTTTTRRRTTTTREVDFNGINLFPVLVVAACIFLAVTLFLALRSWRRRPHPTTPWEWELAEELERVGSIAGRRRHPSEPIGRYSADVDTVLESQAPTQTGHVGDRLSDHVYGTNQVRDAERSDLFAQTKAARPVARATRRSRAKAALRRMIPGRRTR
jgi:hypothetical protein